MCGRCWTGGRWRGVWASCRRTAGCPVAWTPYLASDDVGPDRRRGTAVRRHGGGRPAGRRRGRADGHRLSPSGAVFGIWQRAAQPVRRSPAYPHARLERAAHLEAESVAKFYKSVFGYEEEPVVSADFDYLTSRLDGPAGGRAATQARRCPGTGAALADVLRGSPTSANAAAGHRPAGGRILRPAQDSAHGRVATVADPRAPKFTVVQGPAPGVPGSQEEGTGSTSGDRAAARADAAVIRRRWWRRHSIS